MALDYFALDRRGWRADAIEGISNRRRKGQSCRAFHFRSGGAVSMMRRTGKARVATERSNSNHTLAKLRNAIIGDIHLLQPHLITAIKHSVEQINDKITPRHREKALDILE